MKKISEPFSALPNRIINDDELSLKAKGLILYILSKPDDWNFSAGRMAKESKDGVESVKAGINELISLGYLSRHKLPNGFVRYKITI